MRKIFLLSACVLCVALFTAGCATKNNVENSAGGQTPNQNGGFQSASGTPQMNFGTEINISELVVGKMVTVFGTTNSDGTISATRIILGEMPMMDRGSASGTPKKFTKTTVDDYSSGSGNGSAQGGSGGGMQPPSGGQFMGGERPDRGSTSDEDETKIQQRARPSGESTVVGEIMSIDTGSLTLKVKDGGSKIVYYTTNTKAYLAPTSTQMMAPPSSTEMMGPLPSSTPSN
ncbi:MAG: DUF5666 domain-containing protein [Patescibacteria group bacterium]